MSTFEFTASWSGPRHRAGRDFDWAAPRRWAFRLWLAVVALAVFAVWAYVATPALVDLIGLWPTRAVGVALIAVLLWRR